MHFQNSNPFPGWASSLFKHTAFVAGLATMTACASVGGLFRTDDSPLPIHTSNATGGNIASARAFETSDRLYVAGSLRRLPGYHLASAAHVDVQLLDRSGRVLAEKQDNIDSTAHPRTTGGRSRRSSYVASFPLDLARQAASIRVSYHLEPHIDSDLSGASSR